MIYEGSGIGLSLPPSEREENKKFNQKIISFFNGVDCEVCAAGARQSK